MKLTKEIGGYVFYLIQNPPLRPAWNEVCGKFHIVRTFGLEPWELYRGDFEDPKQRMNELVCVASAMRDLALAFKVGQNGDAPWPLAG
jgi:hypothetical protein